MTKAAEVSIQVVPGDPNLRRVRIGRRTVATLRATDVEALGIRAGMKWDAAAEARVLRANDMERARKAALRSLARRTLSGHELRQRIASKGHAADIVESVVKEMADHGWIDDEALGRSLTAELARKGPVASRLVSAKLRARGVDDKVAARIAKEAGADSEDQALRFARRHLEKLTTTPRARTARRIAGLLARRGFDEEIVNDVLHRVGLLDSNS